MPTWTLRRRDGSNQGMVGCPSGRTYPVDLQACVVVTDEADRDALLEVGRPPQFMRAADLDRNGFWELVEVDGVRVAKEAFRGDAFPGFPPRGIADPEAVRILGGGAAREEVSIEAEDIEKLIDVIAPRTVDGVEVP